MTSELEKSAAVQNDGMIESAGREFPGAGLVKGLVTTFKTMTRPAHTVQYPDQPPELPPRTRGVIALVEENCTVCMLCARECPDWCIYIDSHKETIPAPPGGGRERTRNVLDRFFAGSAEQLVVKLLSSEDISPRERARIQAMLEESEQ